MRLQSKIIALLIPLVIIPLLTLGFLAYSQLHDTSERKTLEGMQIQANQLALQAKLIVETATANADLFSGSAILERYLLINDDATRYGLMQAPLFRLLASCQKAYPSYCLIRVLLPDGRKDAGLDNQFNSQATADVEQNEEFLQRIIRAEKDSQAAFLFDAGRGKATLLVSKRIRLRDPGKDPINMAPTIRGYLVINVDLSLIENQINAYARITQGASMFLTDQRGTVLANPTPGRNGKLLPQQLFARLKQLINGEKAVTASYDGQPYFFVGARIYDDLYIYTALPETELRAISNKLGRTIAGITGLAIFIGVAYLFKLLKYMLVRPIQELSDVAGEIGRGNLDITIKQYSDDEVGDLSHALQDMKENLRRSGDRIHYLAYHDHLTGLPNRLMFEEFLNHAIAHAKRTNKILALLFLDLDNFKRINDTLGHHLGDKLLQQLADRLEKCLREEDFLARAKGADTDNAVARLGGDEFILLITNLTNPYVTAKIANRILSTIAESFTIAQHDIYITSSIGIVNYPDDGKDAETLLKNADIAMYHAKKQGKSNYQYYLNSMNVAAFAKLTMENELRKALDKNELLLYYQPQVDAQTHKIKGFEALLRWKHPNLGMVSPGQFIPVAEESGLIVPIGAWVIREACRQAASWVEAGLPAVRVAVNLSSIQFRKQQIERLITKALQETGLTPDLLEVELTESSIMQEEKKAIEILNAIKEIGVNIALDDFGTGYSSLSYLCRFPIDTIKIDRSFIKHIMTNKDDAAIIKAILAMAQNLGLSVIAEGVEEMEQLNFLKENGCSTIQGFLFSPPVPAKEAEQFLKNQSISPKASD